MPTMARAPHHLISPHIALTTSTYPSQMDRSWRSRPSIGNQGKISTHNYFFLLFQHPTTRTYRLHFYSFYCVEMDANTMADHSPNNQLRLVDAAQPLQLLHVRDVRVTADTVHEDTSVWASRISTFQDMLELQTVPTLAANLKVCLLSYIVKCLFVCFLIEIIKESVLLYNKAVALAATQICQIGLIMQSLEVRFASFTRWIREGKLPLSTVLSKQECERV